MMKWSVLPMKAYAGKLLAVAVVFLALCASGCLAQEMADEEREPDAAAAQVIEEETQNGAGETAPADGGEAVKGQQELGAPALGEQESGELAGEPPAQGAALQRIEVSLNQAVLLSGGQARAQVAFEPGQIEAPAIRWSSSDPQVANVDNDGLVWALDDAQVPDDGVEVDIWARTTDGSLAMDCATLRVMPAVRSLSMLEDETRLAANDFTAVAVEIEPESLVGVVPVQWASSDERVAWVSASGAGEVALIYAGAPGQATITARAQDGSGCADSLTVIIE